MSVRRDERIKLLIVNGSLHVGGAEMQLARLVPQIDRRLFDVHVAYYNYATDSPKKILQDASIPVTFIGRKIWSRNQYLCDAYKWIKSERFDLVHAWSASTNHYAGIPAILAGVPVVVGGLRGKGGLEGVWPYVYSLTNKKSSGWIVNSRALGEFATKEMAFMKNCPIKIVKNGFDCTDESIFKRNERTFYDELKGELPVVGIVGRLHSVKNHSLFLEMAKRLTMQGVNADYWIIGDGPEREKIENNVLRHGLEDKVKILGLRDDVDVALSRMDLLVLTSRSESCPNVLLEAMRASLPVVATNCTSLEDIIDDGKNGYVVPVEDVNALVHRVKTILKDSEIKSAMGAESKKIVQERFNLSLASNELEKAYRFFLERKRERSVRINRKLKYLETF